MSIEKHLKIAAILVTLLENKFGFWKFRFGFDPVIGLVPILGDILPYILSFYFIFIGIGAGMPKEKIIKMIIYSSLDFALGIVPIFGDILDFFYHGHLKNYQLLKDHIDQANSYS